MTDFDHMSHAAQLPILHELALAAVQNYHLPPSVTVRLVNLSENATYAVQSSEGRRWALRIHRGGYHSRAAIASELAWLQDLRATQVVITPAPVPGRDGEIIQVVGHPRMTAPRHVVLSHWEDGTEPGIEADLSRPFEILGEATTRMHRHTRNWLRPTWFTRPVWNFATSLGHTPHWGRWRDGIGVDAEKAALFDRTATLIERRLATYGQGQDRFGLIHCDLRLANLLTHGDAVKVIDFDDCGFSWFMYDAATPVSFYEHERHVPDLIDAWKTGYRTVMDLPPADEAEIPTFIMLRRLLLVAWIGSHSETGLAKSTGLPYTDGTMALCDHYLSTLALRCEAFWQHLPAVDDHRLSGHIPRLFGREIKGSIANLGHRTQSPHGNRRGHGGLIGRPHRLQPLGQNVARQNRVDRYAVARKFNRSGAHKAQLPGLARPIMRPAGIARDRPGDRGGQDDPPLIRGFQIGDRRLHRQKRAFQVGVGHLVPLCFGHLFQRRLRENPGIGA